MPAIFDPELIMDAQKLYKRHNQEMVKDFETGENVSIDTVGLVKGIVEFEGGEPIYGYFTSNYLKNILVIIPNEGSVTCISKDILPKPYTFAFDNSKGYYQIIKNGDPKIPLMLETKGQGNFPYTIGKVYNAEHLLDKFEGKEDKYAFYNKYENLLKYTIGVEFEASKGYVPQEECFKLGLVPLRDGSISSVEYATIVLDKTKLGLLKTQVQALKKYTDFDKECSLHFHFGSFPVSSKMAFALYKVFKAIEPQLKKILPIYTFETARYKRTGKDYCKQLPNFRTFEELYYWVSDHNTKYHGSLTENHPCDEDKRGKWNIQSRYYALNLVNLLFYNTCKTVEFRMLRPTYNFDRILFWIYAFNAILLFSESVTKTNKTMANIELLDLSKLKIEDIFNEIYPHELSISMNSHLDLERYISSSQASVGDFIGAQTKFEDIMYTSVIEK